MNKNKPVGQALAAAALFGMSAPFSKLLLTQISATLMASLLYLGAGIGMLFLMLLGKRKRQEAGLTKKDSPYVFGMIVLDIAAPICLMIGLQYENPATASLLNNFEIVATALIALCLFREQVGKRMWLAIGLITLASILLSMEHGAHLSFSSGSLFILLACTCWGLENNCTRMLSLHDPLQIVIIKGFGAGAGSFCIAAASRSLMVQGAFLWYIPAAMLLGFFAYGLSIYLYICAQRELGAARTSAYYAVAPFIGVALSLLFFMETLPPSFWIAGLLMAGAMYLTVKEEHEHVHLHESTTHIHSHSHHDGHHLHTHPEGDMEHSHEHSHDVMEHEHPHKPDMHHRHSHTS